MGKTIVFLNFGNHFSQRLPKTQNIVSQFFSCVTNIPLMSYELWNMYKSWLSHYVVIAHWKSLPLCHLMRPAHCANNNGVAKLRCVMRSPPLPNMLLHASLTVEYSTAAAIEVTFLWCKVSMLPIVLVNGLPNLINAPNVCNIHTLLLAIVSIMHVLHQRRSIHQALQLRVGIARINLAKTSDPQELLRILPPDFRFEGYLVILAQNEITVWKVLLDLFS